MRIGRWLPCPTSRPFALSSASVHSRTPSAFTVTPPASLGARHASRIRPRNERRLRTPTQLPELFPLASVTKSIFLQAELRAARRAYSLAVFVCDSFNG